MFPISLPQPSSKYIPRYYIANTNFKIQARHSRADYQFRLSPTFFHHPEPTMYASKAIPTLIAVLSAGALAVPTTMTPTLNFRDTTGSITHSTGVTGTIAGYHSDDCTRDSVPGTAQFHHGKEKDNCVAFNTPAEYVGVFFNQFKSMMAYSDEDCQNKLENVTRPANYRDGAPLCSNQHSAFGNIGSVRFFDTPGAT